MKDQRVGMIGLGIMGSAMSGNLLQAGFEVLGFDLDRARQRDHRRAGGTVARDAADVARREAVVITSLPSAAALARVSESIARGGRKGLVVIETSTLPVPVKAEAHKRLAGRGIVLLDCPLSGTGAQAKKRDLAVYLSGSRAACRAVLPIVDAFARAHYYVGPFGAGSKMKFIANLLVAIHNVAAAEAMVLAMKAGLDPKQVLEAVGAGAGSSRMFQVRGPHMVRGRYRPAAMKVDIWQKDMQIIGEFARQLACPTPLFAAAAPIYNAAVAMGFGSEDTASVCAVLERMASLRRKRR